MVGTVLTDPACAPLVADCGIASMLIGMLKDKQEDDEIVLQIIFVWNKLLYYKSTRDVVLSEPQAVSYLLDLMHDQNTEIRKVCNRFVYMCLCTCVFTSSYPLFCFTR
eukprot:m.110246 g.110246  ORF g.110246 m.110246 type:complete len:108 (+) comp12743_c1_seq2:176-499(+)